jgi:hypothetical protein
MSGPAPQWFGTSSAADRAISRRAGDETSASSLRGSNAIASLLSAEPRVGYGWVPKIAYRASEANSVKRRRIAAPGPASAPPLSLGRPARRTPGHTHARRSARLTPDAATVPWTIEAGRVRPATPGAGPAWSPAA